MSKMEYVQGAVSQSVWDIRAEDLREGDTIVWRRVRLDGSVDEGTAVVGAAIRDDRGRTIRRLAPAPPNGARPVVTP